MGDEEGLLQEGTYDFNVKNIGSSPAKYDLKLINEVPSTYTGKERYKPWRGSKRSLTYWNERHKHKVGFFLACLGKKY